MTSVDLVSTSRAGDAGYLAARDLTVVATTLDVPYRLVGGLSVTVLTAVHGVTSMVPARETADADFAANLDVLADPRLVPALTSIGYRQVAGNRFVRNDAASRLELTVDLLGPGWTSQLRPNEPVGDLVIDAVPGLGLALAMAATTVRLTVALLSGESITMRVDVPDVVAAVCLKSLAWKGRHADRDLVDLLRLLEAAHASGVRAPDWPLTGVRLDTARILHGHVLRSSRAPARLRALVPAVVARP